jgi:hypothetical protein
MTVGEILLPRAPMARTQWRTPELDPADACSQTLAAYLLGLTFVVSGGATGAARYFQLLEVLDEWPEAGRDVPYPCASLAQAGVTMLDAHNLVPTALEDTYETFGLGTVLWKLHEARVDLQADFWTNSDPDRSAIGAALPGAFSPGEDTGRVVLCGPDGYFCRPVRVCLLDMTDVDTPASVYANERRLRSTIRCELDVVELRCATLLAQPDFRLQAAGPDVEITDVREADPVSCDDCDDC